MKKYCFVESAGPAALREENSPAPIPARGEVLIRVRAAGIIPTEAEWYPTHHTPTGEKRTAAVPAHEFCGTIAATGEDVGTLEIGREVFGMNDWFSDGALAEYCSAPYFAVAPAPPPLNAAEAASVPISALTAWQGLFDRAKLAAGEHVLVHGGAGGVGTFAIQLAKFSDARVITTASARNRDFLLDLGADEVIDYRTSRFEDRARDVDVVFDTVGGETRDRSWRVLKQGGRMVTVASDAEASSDERVRKAFFIVEPNQKQLYEIACLLETGRLRTVVRAVLPFAQAPDAYTGELTNQGRGKIVVSVE
jgi:NADPH:quinone reductase-like Zn-dependent oxidoreductase